MQVTISPQINFTADIKRLFDKGLIPEVKKGFYGNSLTSKNASREHLVPHCKGGTRTEANIVLADRLVNNIRGAKPIKDVADSDTAIEYLAQFKGIELPEHKFYGNAYIMKIAKTLKRLGMDIMQQAKQMISDSPETIKETTSHIDLKI